MLPDRVAVTERSIRHQEKPRGIAAPVAEAGTMTDQTIIAIARPLAVALARAGYSRDPRDKQEVARLQSELCAAIRQEEKDEKASEGIES
jgi:hypothetical protein